MIDVCVVGSFMMDLVIRAPRRPATGETLVGTSFEMFLGGKGFNQAVAAARSGARTAMVGTLGADDFGALFREALSREGIGSDGVGTSASCGTGVAAPLVDDHGDNSIVIVPRANHDASSLDVPRAAVVLLQLELPVPVVVDAARRAHDQGSVVILNPAPAALDSLAPFAGVVDYVVPNEAEATHLTGISCQAETIPAVAAALAAQTGGASVVLTLGSRGVLVGTELVHAHAVRSIDSVGAGDAFCGALAATLARGAPLRDAARYGNAAGAISVTRHGASPSMPQREEIEKLL